MTAPVAAVTAATAGSSTLAKERISSSAPAPIPIREFTSATATAVTARVPASVTAAPPLAPKLSCAVSANPTSSRMASSSTPDRTARRTIPWISRLPVSSSVPIPSSSVSP